MNYSLIPDELKGLARWVNTFANSKIPFRPFEIKQASASASDTWGLFSEAKYAVENRIYDNIGFVFANDGYVGIDIDAGFENGDMTGLAIDIINACKSYTEVSRSGRGVHIILKGDIPFDGRNNRNGVEIYKTNRFFIVTGKQIMYSDIVENQKAIDYVIEKYFKDAMPMSTGKNRTSNAFYNLEYRLPANGKVNLRPVYSPIACGCRNTSLLSIAGQMWSIGYRECDILQEIERVNTECCDTELPYRELSRIVRSATRYQR